MSYQVIARKWRPQKFGEVIGQEAVTRTLRNAIEFDRLHHAYIFSGARGVGKTTTARLLAKSLNCHKTEKPNPDPCDVGAPDVCPSCLEIAESRSLDVLEFDAASHTKVEEIREIILESINVNPARDRYKVFIIDEVHMLSKSSFNALLKTLEEPPENVVFIMATTELHKVPDTILSRVQEFEFRTIPLQKIYERLKMIAGAEKIDVSEAGLKEIARSGEGSMRDAQSNFDQVISFSGEKIDVEDVVKALGIASAEHLVRTVGAIAERDPAAILGVVDDLISRGQDLRHFCTDLLTFLRDLLVFRTAAENEHLLDTAIIGPDELRKISEPFSAADLIRFFNSLAETESRLREASQPRYMLEVGLLKLVEMGRLKPTGELLERLAGLEKRLAGANDLPTVPETPPAAEPEPAATAEKKTLRPDIPDEEIPFPVKGPRTQPAATETAAAAPAPDPSFEPPTPEPPPANEVVEEPPADPPDEVSVKPAATASVIDVSKMPVKLEPISSDELEHVEDKWLDRKYEYCLRHEGDDLRTLEGAGRLITDLLGATVDAPFSEAEPAPAGKAAQAAAPARATGNKALEIVSELTRSEEIDETLPDFPADPTEEELLEYARKHPSVRRILKIFRGQLVGVTRNEDPA